MNKSIPFKAKKKPVVIEAILWDGTNIASIKSFAVHPSINIIKVWKLDGQLAVWNTLEVQWINCPVGHFIIKGIKGEFYPCEPKVFEQTYEILE